MQIIEEAKKLTDNIFSIKGDKEFEKTAINIFRFQYKYIGVYKQFVDYLNVDPADVKSIQQIPFMPIEFFKSHPVYPPDLNPEKLFTSSGTTGSKVSKHYVVDQELYINSFTKGFDAFYGSYKDYIICALLPAYLEREGSSLVYMVDYMIRNGKKGSGFYLNNYDELIKELKSQKDKNNKVLLIGVSFALLDIAESNQLNLSNVTVMETGGMKGRRKELIREELHSILENGLGVKGIHSEYGMTELLSQAYSKGDGLFQCPPWMKVICRDMNDPLSIMKPNKSGGINVIDLANVYSCSFIATQDIGKVYDNGLFEVLGRFDSSDIRGCNLLVF
ncbi:MAG: hypothetical protein ACEPOV_00825 [Hyphomicrobiales bacterium]